MMKTFPLILFLAAPFSSGQGLVEILAIDGEPTGESSRYFSDFDSVLINNRGQIEARVSIRDDLGSLPKDGIYRFEQNKRPRKLVLDQDPFPDRTGNFDIGNLMAISPSGAVAFDDRSQAVFRSSGGTPGKLAGVGTNLPDRELDRFFAPGRIVALEGSDFAFDGRINGIAEPFLQGAITYRVGNLNLVLTEENEISAPFETVSLKKTSGEGCFNRKGAYVAEYSFVTLSPPAAGGLLVLSSNGSRKVIAYDGQELPAISGPMYLKYSAFTDSDPVINDAGQVVFKAYKAQIGSDPTNNVSVSSDGDSGMLVRYEPSGGYTVLIQDGDPVPGGNGRFDVLPNKSSIDASGRVFFSASLTGTDGGEDDNGGIYCYDRGEIIEIYRKGDNSPDGNGTIS